MTGGGRVGRVALAGGVLLAAAVQGAALLGGSVPAWGPWAMLGATVLLFTGMLASGLRRGGERPFLGPLAVGATALLIGVPFAVALRLPPEVATDALWGGLPRRAAIVIYGVGLLPALLLPLLYALEHPDDPVETLRARLAEPEGDPAP